MRIGTWNVEYAGREGNPYRRAILTARDADIWVLTETHADLDLSDTHFPVVAEARPGFGNAKVGPGSTWVTIWSRYRPLWAISVPDHRRTVAAVFDAPGGPVAVAGVVLPWHDDVGDTQIDPRPAHWVEHRRVLRDEFPVLLRALRESGAGRRVVAGDFNSHLALPYPLSYPYPPDESLRRELVELLGRESLVCHTADTEYPKPLPPRLVPQKLIDHVCTDMGSVEKIESWSGIDDESRRLSDHPGVIVTVPSAVESADERD
jgi:endonuclease/exonuclease/phosphatase family metal-dependent hydrolase